MGRSRQDLQDLLETLVPPVGPDDFKAVYFQPPSNLRMVYPCIEYHLDYAETKHADNVPYSHTKRYQATVIDEDPDSEIYDKMALLPLSSFKRFFVVEQLNHFIFNVYF